MKTLYTFQMAREDDSLYDATHGSDDGFVTICGEEVDRNWWITDNNFNGDITCKKCLKILKEKPTIQERQNTREIC